ncbi:hypothetical protein [Streptomyces caniscabiei]|uniref:hypothetical protein n=1 Tax=Streptomyces caniscabiei TaxID=2746961 RepID=UPI0018731543|nr:hypothetical protein [Streptomyces caniscabiei]MBE4761821.1 hypothetical protein [Streptomyces caniscabiei]MDX2947940.1 hypothetical protein [Streptomyces caniscabiei]MDX2986423.1 hypothetical protein [Streptomyces caniscabiei]
MKRLRRIAAALALATAAGTGVLLADTLAPAADADTAWGAPTTTDTGTEAGATETVVDLVPDSPVVVTPLDTAWG